MKKLLLLSALLIFACSSDDSSDTNDDNNTSSQRLIESVELFSVQQCGEIDGFISEEVFEIFYNSQNNPTSYNYQVFETSCDESYLVENSNNLIQYNQNSIFLNSDNEVNEFILNDNGFLENVYSSYNLTYINGGLSSWNYSDDGNAGSVQVIWENGNYVEINYLSDDNSFERTYHYNYTNYENKTKLFNPILIWHSPYLPLRQFLGATSQKLISEVQWAYDNVSSLTVKVKYDYSFDGDGYVTYVTIGKYFLNEQNEYLDSEITYKLTYTN